MPNQPKQYFYNQISIGQRAEFDYKISAKVVAAFAELSGDKNPLHVDPQYAALTEFKKPVAHGMIAAMLFSRLIGMELPGKYALYLSQSLNFHCPIFFDQEIIVGGEVIQKNDAFSTVILLTKICDKISSRLIVDGQALVRLLK